MRTTFDMSPSELRKLRSGRKKAAGQGGITLYLPYRPPFDWHTLIRFSGGRATPGTEVIEDECYRRTIEINGQAGEIEVRPEPEESRLRVRVTLPSYEQLMIVVEKVRRIFDLGADPCRLQITSFKIRNSAKCSGRDPVCGSRAYGTLLSLRSAPCWVSGSPLSTPKRSSRAW